MPPNIVGIVLSALHEFHYPLPTSNVAVQHRISVASFPKAVWQCITIVPLPTALRHCAGRCGSAVPCAHRQNGNAL